MNEIFERRSIRKFQDRPVAPEQIERLLRAAMAAPTARDAREWDFVVVTDRALIARLAQVHPYTGCAAQAPVVFVPVAARESEFWQQDLGASVQNLLLEARHLGLGGVWMGIAPMTERMAAVAAILGLPEGVRPFCILPVGWPAEEKPPRGLWEPEKVHYNGW